MASLEQQRDTSDEKVIKNGPDNGTPSATKPEPKPKPKPKSKLRQWIARRADATWKNLQTNHLWQRILKNTLATTIATIFAILPPVVAVYGKATYLACIATVFGHPGRRFGQMAEALVLTVLGATLGTAWSTLGLFLSALVYKTNPPAAYTIKGIFLVIALMVHGFLRSHTPRLFIMVLLMIIVSVVSLTGTNTSVTATLVTTLMYPILTAAGLLLLVNLCIFPEFSSSFLGITTIETLGETVGAVRHAGRYFISISSPSETPTEEEPQQDDLANEPGTAAEPSKSQEGSKHWPSIYNLIKAVFHSKNISRKDSHPPSEPKKVDRVKLKSLTDQKAKLRAKLDSCKAAQQECNFELAFSVLPPRDLKPVSDTAMKKIVANTVALIGACESKYALVGDDSDNEDQESPDQKEEASAGSDHETGRNQSAADESTEEETEKQQNEEKRLKKHSRERKGKTKLQKGIEELELVKPEKEIKFGDPELLRALIQSVSRPIVELQDKIDKVVDVVTSCLAYCYDVSRLPDGSRPPHGIKLEEIDIWSDVFEAAIAAFDKNSASCLESAAALQDLGNSQIDIMPRMETFLISSFLLNFRQAALHIQEMLAHSRKLVESRQFRHDKRRIYAPRINWRKWLSSGGEEDMLALPSKGRKDARSGTGKELVEHNNSATSSVDNLIQKQNDEEAALEKSKSPQAGMAHPKTPLAERTEEKGTLGHRFRNRLADIVEYLSASDDVLYAVKLTIAAMLVTWPAFVSNWNTWYSLNRGLWAALQLVLITEVAIGTSVSVFILRALGTTFGCVWGYAAFQAGNGDRVICVVILAIGIIPSAYVQLGTQYVKAGMVSIVSMCVVALATEDQTVPGTATETFLKRLLAFLIGAVVALVVELTLFPVKARDRLVESLAASIRQISEMEACLAYGIESEMNVDVDSPEVSERFDNAKSKAQAALTAAETFLPFCAQEPRLKGSFAGLALVYSEILYVLHQIVDKMDNMLQLRKEYGSGVLEELNAQVYPYRRNVAGSITLILFAVHEALTTKLPLPQFLPSARLAHLRMVNRVREVVLKKTQHPRIGSNPEADSHNELSRSQLELSVVKRIVRQKFLSWNAASAGQIEVIEFLEELIELVKLLVGANEFRSGMLTRPTYREYIGRVGQKNQEVSDGSKEAPQKEAHRTEKEIEQDELRDIVPVAHKLSLGKRRSPKQSSDQIGKILSQAKSDNSKELERQKKANDEELPRSLQRVRSRRIEEQTEMVELKIKGKDEGL